MNIEKTSFWVGSAPCFYICEHIQNATTVLFIRLIIRLFQLVFSVGTVFFSHNISANSVFQLAYQHSRTAPTSVHEEINSKLNLLRLTALIYIKNYKKL
jgi:hypothetical protein